MPSPCVVRNKHMMRFLQAAAGVSVRVCTPTPDPSFPPCVSAPSSFPCHRWSGLQGPSFKGPEMGRRREAEVGAQGGQGRWGEDERSPWELILRLAGLNAGTCEVDLEGRGCGIPTRASEDGKV